MNTFIQEPVCKAQLSNGSCLSSPTQLHRVTAHPTEDERNGPRDMVVSAWLLTDIGLTLPALRPGNLRVEVH